MEQQELIFVLLEKIERLSIEIGALRQKLYANGVIEFENEHIRKDLEVTSEVIYQKVVDCPFQNRTQKSLFNNNILTLQDLVRYNEKDLMRLPKFGMVSLDDIKKYLAGLGLTLGMEVYVDEDGKCYTFEEKAVKGREVWSKKIRCIETGMVFNSIRDCSNEMKIPYMTVYNCILNGNQSRDGFSFEEIKDY